MRIIGIITLFPELFPGPLGCSIFYKGLEKQYWQLNIINLRDYGDHVDDTIYGGSEGMLMRPDVLGKAIDDHIKNYDHMIFTVPFGKTWRQNLAKSIAFTHEKILIVCGRYEGIDYRIFQYYQENYSVSFISLGDFILAGGEVAAMAIGETILRWDLLRWKVLEEESFNEKKLLEAPQYTKPKQWKNLIVPEVLMNGNHGAIQKWNLENAIIQTQIYRPDLLDK